MDLDKSIEGKNIFLKISPVDYFILIHFRKPCLNFKMACCTRWWSHFPRKYIQGAKNNKIVHCTSIFTITFKIAFLEKEKFFILLIFFLVSPFFTEFFFRISIHFISYGLWKSAECRVVKIFVVVVENCLMS